jgi:hypothetical protein
MTKIENDNQVKIVQIIEVGTTLRLLFICLLIAFGLFLVWDMVLKIVIKPNWLQVFLGIVSALSAPSIVIYWLLDNQKKAIKSYSKRVKELEKKLDPKRTSSEREE